MNGTSRVFSQTYSVSGASVDPKLITLKFIELGGVVTCYFPNFDVLPNGTSGLEIFLTPTTPLNDKFLPGYVEFTVFTKTQSIAPVTPLTTNGLITMNNNGNISIYSGFSTTNTARKTFTITNPIFPLIGVSSPTSFTYMNKIINP